jgi:hypothetical protein
MKSRQAESRGVVSLRAPRAGCIPDSRIRDLQRHRKPFANSAVEPPLRKPFKLELIKDALRRMLRAEPIELLAVEKNLGLRSN